MKRHIKFCAERYSSELGLQKNKWYEVDDKDKPFLQDEFFDLITTEDTPKLNLLKTSLQTQIGTTGK